MVKPEYRKPQRRAAVKQPQPLTSWLARVQQDFDEDIRNETSREMAAANRELAASHRALAEALRAGRSPSIPKTVDQSSPSLPASGTVQVEAAKGIDERIDDHVLAHGCSVMAACRALYKELHCQSAPALNRAYYRARR